MSFCDFLNGNVPHILGFLVSASLRPLDSLLCRWEVTGMLAWQGGRFATHNKQNAEHTKQNPEQKSRYVSGLGIKTT